MRIIVGHWTAGTYRVSAVDRKHYHRITDGDGKTHSGKYKPEDNRNTGDGKYAAHTRNANTDAIGCAMACMKGAQERPLSYGKYPMREAQFDAFCRDIAVHCKRYDIVVSAATVLSHAEVEGTLGIKQRGKWDFTVLPFMPHLKGARACGDEMRRRVKAFLQNLGGVEVEVEADPDVKRTRWLQRLLINAGYPLGEADGIAGRLTQSAIELFQRDNGLPVTGEFDRRTIDALKAAKPKEPTVVEKPVTSGKSIVSLVLLLIAAVAGWAGMDVSDLMEMLNNQ